MEVYSFQEEGFAGATTARLMGDYRTLGKTGCIVFAKTIADCENYFNGFLMTIDQPGMITGGTRDSQVRTIINGFNSGNIHVLCNLAIILEPRLNIQLDGDRVRTIILARKLTSSQYEAICRLTTREDCVMIDYCGNVAMFGLPEWRR